MKIAVVGTGFAGRTLAGGLAELGHQVVIGTRDVAQTLARTKPDVMGNVAYPVWAQTHGHIGLAPFAEAAEGADFFVNATSGAHSVEALTAAGARNLAGKVLLDVSNPLDFQNGFPPNLFVKDTDSLGEQIQRAFPEARVVKSLNTMVGNLFVTPKAVADGDTTVWVSGDDAEAKRTVTELLTQFGWSDVIDLGGIATARATEMMVQVRLLTMTSIGTPMFNFKIAR
ncbi:NAD(P)-binding domain-containing protein [Actinacidiphila sp. DG2A-62]|uniref:NADPH-dependent F420 reductase n=1 Tax=Actinacidiphila sp. DG2A-62 TaxID=3108821 RepID=UPI002DBCFB81|nr:NAD(P)-binding domain-containing protein [Actinacidiphila sp. DG2A-62]MEC3994874.1 NAD(P)-binding domain-containing protein [Actinacidiphila sp. DG2A-62]